MNAVQLFSLKTVTLLVFSFALFVLFIPHALAADTISSSNYLDTDGDGTVDTIRWTMDETVTACAYEAGDWNVDVASELNISITGISCTGANNVLNIQVDADELETGAATAPQITYVNAGTLGSVTLTSGAMGNAHSTVIIDDAAAPVIVSTTPTSGSTGITRSTSIVFVFSEAMSTSATYNFTDELSISPAYGVWSNGAWSVSNTTLTFTQNGSLPCATSLSITSTEADFEDGSSNVLVTTGPEDGDWVFRTIGCSELTMPTNVSVSLVGASCAAENLFNIEFEGENISEYIASTDSSFIGSTWSIAPSSGAFTHALEDGQTLYVSFRSSNGQTSDVFEVIGTSEWTEVCTEGNVEPDEEEDDDAIDLPSVRAGDYVRSISSSAVYYIDSDLTRRPFMDEQTFFTWQENFDDVMIISDSEIASLTMGTVMLPKTGVVLVKVRSIDKVYWLEENSTGVELRWIQSEEDAKNMFGSLWADYVIDVSPTMYTLFEKGEALESDERPSRTMLKRRSELTAR